MYTASEYVKGAKNFIKDVKQDVDFEVIENKLSSRIEMLRYDLTFSQWFS